MTNPMEIEVDGHLYRELPGDAELRIGDLHLVGREWYRAPVWAGHLKPLAREFGICVRGVRS